MVRVTGRVGLTRKKHGSGHGSTRFCFGSKKSGSGRVFFGSGRVGLKNYDPFCHVYLEWNSVEMTCSIKGRASLHPRRKLKFVSFFFFENVEICKFVVLVFAVVIYTGQYWETLTNKLRIVTLIRMVYKLGDKIQILFQSNYMTSTNITSLEYTRYVQQEKCIFFV